ncbi:ABC transporter substrate-binding protein [uncultured Pseudodesulfovibrio sp.]|uniref:ABC transporter substrate-binding protein n=1 Tax=uncultured Pseudodesulfovibrio sp. TaxID=2035858 RepID=UPI0029C85BCA|nr:ABC transporter substrate-binding protein [uncultured Pseudodesulfovibrio sp.]
MKRLSICLALMLSMMLAVASTASADALAEIVKRGELRVAVQTQCPPFSFLDKNGNRTGSSVEFCRLMAKEMGVEIKFMDYDWDGLIPALLSGKADMLAADMTANLQRALKVSFTDAFYYTGSVAVTKADSNITSWDQINKEGMKVAVLLGGTGEADAKRLFPNAEIKSYKGGGPMLLNALMAGKADVAVNDKTSISGSLASFPPNTTRFVGDIMSKQPLAFAVRHEDENLRQWINLFFGWVKSDGRYDENIKYWVDSKTWEQDH